MNEIRKRVLKRVKPTPQEQKKLQEATAVLVEELRSALTYKKLSAKVFVGGSTAKGTGLKNNQDVDIFVRFMKEKNISDVLESAIELLPDVYERVHGSRDYFHIQRGKIMFELVPVLNITSPKKAENVTDMSPLHVTYAVKRLSSRMKDDVRLAKQLCKAQRVYGAESYLNGFSGHVLELLTIHYGSFHKLMKAASTWGEQVVIDLEKHHKNPLRKLNEAKTLSPLIMVDPVQPERNAAASLSRKSFDVFKMAARKSVNKPTISLFTIKKLTKETIKKKYRTGAIVITEFKGIEGKRDVVGAKCLKAFEYMYKQLEGFTIVHSDFEYDHERSVAIAYIHVKEKKLPATFEQQGPPTKAIKGVASFKKKHRGKKIVEQENRLYVVMTRTHRTLRAAITDLLKDSYVTSRVRGARLV